MYDDHRVLTGITTTLLSVIALGCAGPTTERSARLADATAASSPTSNLRGTWTGFYWNRSVSTSEKPMIALRGVRSSWDMFARNSDLC